MTPGTPHGARRGTWLRALVGIGCISAGLLLGAQAFAAPHTGSSVSFGLLAPPPSEAPEEALRSNLQQARHAPLAFVVQTGFKTRGEACSDALYEERKSVLEESAHALLLSLTAADWAECKREDGSSAAVDRLARARELFFEGPQSLGQHRLPVVRQSAAAQFRSFDEHMRWEVKGVLFATLNVPGDNNHYVRAAGRNSEFEDRMVANRNWLQRLLQAAHARRTRLVVLFFEADPELNTAPSRARANERDAYGELRRQLRDFASRFDGRLLLVHRFQNNKAPRNVQWKGNLGQLALPEQGLRRVLVNPATGQVASTPASEGS